MLYRIMYLRAVIFLLIADFCWRVQSGYGFRVLGEIISFAFVREDRTKII